MRVLLIRNESELTRVAHGDDAVLWLGPGSAPESLGRRALPLPADPTALEGWIALRQLGDETVGTRSVKELLEYEGVSLWWFIHHWLVYGRGLAGWDARYRVLFRLAAARMDGVQPLVLLTDRADDDLVARAFAASRGIEYLWLQPWPAKWRARFGLRWSAALLMQARVAKLLLRGFAGRVMGKNSLAGRGSTDLLFNVTSSTWNAQAGTDRILGPLIEEAAERHLEVTGLHLDFRRNLGLDTLRLLDRRIVVWETLVTPRRTLRAMRAGRRLHRRLAAGFPGSLHGVPAAPLLADRHAVLGARLGHAVLAIETAKVAFEALRPRSLYVVDPYDLWGCALVVAARKSGVPSVEVQHGIIPGAHSGYLHLDGEIAPDQTQASPFSPVPDVIAVHGESAKQSLVENGRFAPEWIRITGSPTIQAARRRSGDRKQIRARLGLDDSSVAALFFGTARYVHPADDAHIRAFLQCCRTITGMKALLRPHPADHESAGRYRSYAMAAGVDAPILVADDPLDLILAADVVVTYNSTTALDAMALDRPVIDVNLSGSPEQVPFARDGAAIDARSQEDLCRALITLSDRAENASQARRNVAYVQRFYADCADPAGAMLNLVFAERSA